MTKLCSLLLCAAVAAALLWSQLPPTFPYTAAEMEGISVTPPRAGHSLRKSIFDGESEKVTAQQDWILVEILAQGNRVRTALNGAFR